MPSPYHSRSRGIRSYVIWGSAIAMGLWGPPLCGHSQRWGSGGRRWDVGWQRWGFKGHGHVDILNSAFSVSTSFHSSLVLQVFSCLPQSMYSSSIFLIFCHGRCSEPSHGPRGSGSRRLRDLVLAPWLWCRKFSSKGAHGT